MSANILIPKTLRITSPAKRIPRQWSEEGSIYKRLPEFYKKSYLEFISHQPKPVHFIPQTQKYKVDHFTGKKERVQNVSPVILYPKQARLGIWGGEGVVFGYLRPKQKGYTRPSYLTTKLWRPRVLRLLFYSEITDKYYSLTTTRRALFLIEEAQGFDNYILKTHAADSQSDFAVALKREMLIKLAKKDTDLYPNDPSKREIIYNRYKKFEMPLEEAEWFGLSPWEAAAKQKKIEIKEANESIRPWKEKFTRELSAYLEQLKLEGKEIPKAEDTEAKLSMKKGMFSEIKEYAKSLRSTKKE